MTLIKLGITFFVIIFLITRKLNPGISLILGGILLSFIYPIPFKEFLNYLLETAISHDTIRLAIMLCMIYFFANLLQDKKILTKMVRNLDSFIPNRKIVIFLSASLVGLIPMPGGALFSAPLVEESTKGMVATNERKAYLNYWFRHVWEGVFPLYPALILISIFLKIPIRTVLLAHFLLPVIQISAGWIFGYRRVGVENIKREEGTFYNFLKYFSPILLIIFLSTVVSIDVVYAIFITTILSLIFLKPDFSEIKNYFFKSFKLENYLLPLGIFLFKNLMNSGIANRVSLELTSFHIDPRILIFFLPFMITFVTGITSTSVGVSYPLIESLLYVNGKLSLSLMGIAFTGAVAGVLLSPLHLCLIVTVKYFKAKFGKVYSFIIPSVIFVSVISVVVYLLLFKLNF